MLKRARAAAPAGFTVLELAIGLVVFGLLLLGAVPSALDWLRASELRNTGAALQRGLERARSEAIARNTAVRFTLVRGDEDRRLDASCVADPAGRAWVVSQDDPEGACQAAPSAQQAPRLIEGQAATDGQGRSTTVQAVDEAGDPASSVRFNGYGRVEGSPAIARIDIAGAAGRRLRLTLGRAGGVRLCDPDQPAGDPRACG